MNKGASDVLFQYLKKDDSLALEEMTQKLRNERINVSRETVRINLKQIGSILTVLLRAIIIVATKFSKT